MKERIILIVAMVVFGMMTHPQRSIYVRPPGGGRLGRLTGWRGRHMVSNRTADAGRRIFRRSPPSLLG